MRRILVTGASGYIGQHLLKYLRDGGFQVRGLTRGAKPPSLEGIEWYPGDVTELTEVSQAIEKCDGVIHLACIPLAQSQQNPFEAFQVNGLGTLNVMEAAYQAGKIPVIYTSTAQVYGRVKRLPLREDDELKGTSPYAYSKTWGELACQAYAQRFEVPVTILRLFNVYGLAADGQERPTVETIFIKKLLAGVPPVIKGSPDEGRDFIHVDDVVQGIYLALNQRLSGEIINLGSGSLITLYELVYLLMRLLNLNLEPLVQPDEKETMQFQADISKADKVLGFRPQKSLESGLAEIAERIRSIERVR